MRHVLSFRSVWMHISIAFAAERSSLHSVAKQGILYYIKEEERFEMRHGGAFRLTGLILGIVSAVVSIAAVVFSVVGLILAKRPVMPRVRLDRK